LNPSFTWGVATSAYQIEGGRHAGGKGESIWDTFSDAGRLADPGDVACDHFHRWQDDLDLMAELGVDAYRLSTAWTRVLPDGDGQVNPDGIEFYRQLLTGMRERGIEPYLTLYHWDLPRSLQDRGGWPERETVDAFERYATVMVENLGDLVSNWITQNEPWVSAFLGHLYGIFPPGQADWAMALRASHHLLLSHGRAMEAIREVDPDARLGIALDCRPTRPGSDPRPATRHFDGFRNRWMFDPIFGLGYPEDMVVEYESAGRIPGGLESFVAEGDMETIAASNDFLGINYYTTVEVTPGAEERDDPEGPIGGSDDPRFTEMGWLVDPAGLEEFLVRVHDEYRPRSILITENGASYSDGPDEDGVIDDTRRIEYLAGHISAVERARAREVPVDGYFVWSFLDNLEWLQGFSQRFGLVWVDHETQQRVPKASFRWYGERIRSKGALGG
jgi:beta-glucosidase